MKNIIIGTAGHIDHGKTTLIKALTGKETDRLKEEKKRGISIDLGFTYFDLPSGKRAGIIDVPGHEKFVKNMLAGVHGMDVVLLVVAADEGVMPQTLEHLEILNFLDIKKGLVVITKADTVDEEFKELVKEDIMEKLEGTFLEDAEIMEVDSISHKGIPELSEKIDVITEGLSEKNLDANPRLSIDRTFSIKGFGTVVTGTLMEGKMNVDDEMMIYPNEIKTKIRSVQVHGESQKTAYAGQRVAINLANVKVEEIERGDVLAKPNSMSSSMMIDVKLKIIKNTERSLKYWDRVRVYHGAKEILARVALIDREELTAGEECYCQLRLEDHIVAKKDDRFVIRFYSPMETIGGGVILETNPKKHKRYDEEVINTLTMKESGDIDYMVEENIRSSSSQYPGLKELAKQLGESEEKLAEIIEGLCSENRVVNINGSYIHVQHYGKLKEKALAVLGEFHAANRLKKGIVKEELRSRVESKLKSKDFDVLLDIIKGDGDIKIVENTVSLSGFNVVFGDKDIQIKNEIEKSIKTGGYAPPVVSELTGGRDEYQKVLEALIGYTLVRVSDDVVYHKDEYQKAVESVKAHLSSNGEITLAEFRDMIGASRKYAMLLLEDFDRNKITKRVGEKRVLF
ncbi:selenocysteine-specific elongation factor [Peptoclostridium litorale DSM 5388]|uniref:Selenocysteine-specific elongation factor n=1 Tax=Peptoclostridium litorale DSM 5388 TaxID=1121324 RepID=A0A069RAM3_PEPLI|nr:selenocysteine-specific translation elongation factor [Peptoclostridium litorale]KDR94094.1 selenocysteine-specific elongation factor SelB [Peptoclostridium litorale DSM 5388]SIN80779.1 selenocysteine-specific elongation factor [Peptoclostridium litorale DSM 5388]